MMNDDRSIGNIGTASTADESFSFRNETGFHRRLGLAAILVLIATIAGAPETHWEMDEVLFHMGIEEFEPLEHHPHPPGYPLLIGLGKLLNLFIGDPFVSLVTLAVISVVVGFAALVIALRNITGSESAGFVAAALFYFSPAMIIHGPTPMSDPPALMFLALAIWAGSRGPLDAGRAALFGLFAAASIGCRPQYAIPLLPALALIFVMCRGWRARLSAVGAFTVLCLGWIIPLIDATGGPTAFLAWQGRQASWVAEVDAGAARHALDAAGLIKRFVAHPWGPKWMSVPVLLLALAGLIRATRSRMSTIAPLIVIAVVHFAFTVATCDPADGVRYILPTHIATAALAALGLVSALRRAPWSRAVCIIVVAIFVTSSYAYVWPVLSVRSTTTSPPVAAVEWIEANVDSASVVVYDDSMAPHVEGLLSGQNVLRHPAADDLVLSKSSTPAILLGEGTSLAPDAHVFRWPYSDAYGKITRNHYRTVTIDPLEPWERFVGVRGVSPWSSSGGRARWRSLEQTAEIELPECCGATELVLGPPPEAPWDEVELQISSSDHLLRSVILRRGEIRRVKILPSEGTRRIVLSSDRSFVPADRPTSAAPVRLSARLYDLRREHDLRDPVPYNQNR